MVERAVLLHQDHHVLDVGEAPRSRRGYGGSGVDGGGGRAGPNAAESGDAGGDTSGNSTDQE
ncbi:MAG TPA: hypothetical protein VIJ56_02460 [Acidimicrobiales bacterium]